MELNQSLNLLKLKLQAYFNVMTWRHASTGVSKSKPQVTAHEPTGGTWLTVVEKLVKMSCTIRADICC